MRKILCLVVLLTAVATASGQVILRSKMCCTKPQRMKPAAGMCETQCVPPGLFCDPLIMAEGSWVDGGCQADKDPKKFCGPAKGDRDKPKYQCAVQPCVQQNGMPGERCFWRHVGDTGAVQAAVKTCHGHGC